jgi:uncharacterized protein GlcG (DUF336 family)
MATKTQELLTLEGARIAIAAAEKKAKEMGLGMNIAVVDASTHLLHFSRMEGAKITSISSMFLHFTIVYTKFCIFLFGAFLISQDSRLSSHLIYFES